MIMPLTALVILTLSSQLPPAIAEPTRASHVELRARAFTERAATIERLREYRHRRHVLAIEREAKAAVDEAPPPPPIVRGPSAGGFTFHQTTIVGGGMGPSPPGGMGIPWCVGRVPDMYRITYQPMLERMFFAW